MTHYPLHATQMSAEPISTSEDVDMEPPKVSADGGEIGQLYIASDSGRFLIT